MTFPIFLLTEDCCCGTYLKDPASIKANPLYSSLGLCVILSSLALDILGTITLIVLGVLGATQVLTMPPAAAYSMIGVAGASILIWTTFILMVACCKDPTAPRSK